jgi:hypothetical protein
MSALSVFVAPQQLSYYNHLSTPLNHLNQLTSHSSPSCKKSLPSSQFLQLWRPLPSTALAGQSLLKPVNELSRKVGNVEARVTMRRAVSKSSASDSIW